MGGLQAAEGPAGAERVPEPGDAGGDGAKGGAEAAGRRAKGAGALTSNLAFSAGRAMGTALLPVAKAAPLATAPAPSGPSAANLALSAPVPTDIKPSVDLGRGLDNACVPSLIVDGGGGEGVYW